MAGIVFPPEWGWVEQTECGRPETKCESVCGHHVPNCVCPARHGLRCSLYKRQRQRQRQRQRLNAKRPVCQSNQSKDAYQNSLAVAEHHRARWAHVNLSRSIAHTLVDRCAIKNFISAFVLCCVCVQVFFAAPAHYALHC